MTDKRPDDAVSRIGSIIVRQSIRYGPRRMEAIVSWVSATHVFAVPVDDPALLPGSTVAVPWDELELDDRSLR